MNLLCFTSSVVGFTFYCLLYVHKCDNAVLNNSKLEQIHDRISLWCSELPKEFLCVPIKSCVTLIHLLNTTELLARQCGPSNQDKTNPKVCCEKDIVAAEALVTTNITPTRRPQNKIYKTTELINRAEKTETSKMFDGCGTQSISSRIFGGKPTRIEEYPWMSRLLTRSGQGDLIFSCSGALIAARVVLTAAHCVFLQETLYAASLGEYNTNCSLNKTECSRNKKTAIISEFVVHPEYDKKSRNHENDIALLILRDKVTFTNHIAPICLQQNFFEATEYFISGWGKTESGSPSNVKLKIILPPFSWRQCAEKYKLLNVSLTNRQICAGGVENADSCQGDSGGPLMVVQDEKWYLSGIVSFGVGCGRKGWPGVYVYVPSYVDWIKEVIRQKVS